MQPIPNSIAAMAEDLTEWRRDLHRHPELCYEEVRTAGIVAARLAEFGVDHVETGIGRTGVVGVIRGRADGPAIMLRADMDALPIVETTGAAHASIRPGVMHACGHDGHTTMLLGAARHLAETRNFAGTVYLCFQPAEEGGAGARAMLDDGLFERYRPRAVYGMHNWPGLPVGHFAVKEGPVLAAADEFTITVSGRGSHAAWPHFSRDPIVIGSQLVSALQTIVSRRIDPLEPAVVSVTQFHAGSAHNVIAETAMLQGTTRCFSEVVQADLHAQVERICTHFGAAFDAEITVAFGSAGYPPTVNDPAEARRTAEVMRSLVGEDRVTFGHPPAMAGEDFSFLAREVPGAFVLIGNGDTAPLHHPRYDFDDSALTFGVAYWARLVETALPAG